ncbi:MAG TPA: amidohydrolase family protein [Blastocatellia bacterium]|nr:amidohydrolase family protein [Blastocatellia bacterium]
MRRSTLFLSMFCMIGPTIHHESQTSSPQTSGAKQIAIRCGKLVDGKSDNPIANAVILIEGDRITQVGPGLKIPAGAQVIDLSRYTVIPGLIDAHTHMTYYWDQAPGTRPWAQLGARLPSMSMFLAQENARKTLETGVTTVRNLHADEYTDIAMRDLINLGAMIGPRMFVSGYGLHVARPNSRGPAPTPSRGQANGVDEVTRAAREQIAAGADWVKMFGSTGSAQDVSGNQTYTFDEMKAAADAAHDLGKKLAVHSYGPAGARDAVRARADSVEHATDMDDATIAEMARGKVFYVPTIDHNRYYAEYREQFGYGPEVAERLEAYVARNLETARRAFKAGVTFAMGSDAVFTMFGQNTRELGWFVKAGMTPQQALTAATANGAALLGMEKSLGAIALGYYADMVAVEGDPLTDIGVVINNVRWVMKGGKVVVDKTKTRKKD